MTNDHDTHWDSPSWQERSDGPWRRRLRRHQGWWRATHTDFGPGPVKGGSRLVVSMLPEGVGLRPNLLTDEAVEAAEASFGALGESRGPGLIDQKRLERNLLSSQPLAFNLFGHLRADPDSLLPWVRMIDADAGTVASIELETAPAEKPIGGSAFDVFVTYERVGGSKGFLGIECKYAEKLTEGQRKPAADKYLEATAALPWRQGAAVALDKPGFRQFWYNTLLVQIVEREGKYGSGRSVVVACSDDVDARAATERVSEQLCDESSLAFSAIEDVVAAVEGHDDWKQKFATRYLNFESSDSKP